MTEYYNWSISEVNEKLDLTKSVWEISIIKVYEKSV